MHEKVVAALNAIGAPGRFAVRCTSAPEDLRLEVKGVGRVPLPVSKTRAGKLRSVARPARYGLREQTLLDPAVRDTWEVPRSRVRIDRRHWNRTLLPQLEQIAVDLGLPPGCRLKAELHSMLVYEPGQFFAPHQDSEKADDMVGTLVVLLPSQARGGTLVVTHGAEKVSFRGSATKLTLIAFYADCRHEVKPLREGWRVALTFDLLRAGAPAEAQVESGQADDLAAAVEAYFHTRREPNWRQPKGEPPARLAILLDHEYTRRSLGWDSLKGRDAARVAALRQVAEQLDCGILLALADVHETWQCEDDDWNWDYRRRRRTWDEDDEDDEVDEGHVLVDLMEYEITFSHCLGSEAGRQEIADTVEGHEICYTTGSDDLEPYAYEHEGYMGNYGNTVDRWYHRAAVVLWPRAHTFALRAQGSAHWALGEVAKRLKQGDREAARQMVRSLEPTWAALVTREERAGFAARVCKVAVDLVAPDLAATLVDPLRLEQLRPAAAPALQDLAAGYGAAWCGDRLQAWEQHHRVADRRSTWLAVLPELCRRLSAPEEAARLARELVSRQCAWVRGAWEDACGVRHSTQRQQRLAPAVVNVLESCRIAGRDDLHGELLAFLMAAETGSPVLGLTQLLRVAHDTGRDAAVVGTGPEGLYRFCVASLRQRQEAPARAPDDWSITEPLDCDCELCAHLQDFLRDPARQQMEWPLAKPRRAHVHGMIDGHDLPVKHETRHQGSPHVLVLTKTKALFQRDAAQRRSWEQELGWLEGKASALG